MAGCWEVQERCHLLDPGAFRKMAGLGSESFMRDFQKPRHELSCYRKTVAGCWEVQERCHLICPRFEKMAFFSWSNKSNIKRCSIAHAKDGWLQLFQEEVPFRTQVAGRNAGYTLNTTIPRCRKRLSELLSRFRHQIYFAINLVWSTFLHEILSDVNLADLFPFMKNMGWYDFVQGALLLCNAMTRIQEHDAYRILPYLNDHGLSARQLMEYQTSIQDLS